MQKENHHQISSASSLYLECHQHIHIVYIYTYKKELKKLGKRKKMAASWVKTITSPFKKACTFLNHPPQQPKDKKSKQGNAF